MYYNSINLIRRFVLDNGKRTIDRKPVVMFDVYNTLISRDCQNPEHVFELVEKTCMNEGLIEASGFKDLRIAAGKKSTKEIFAPTLDQIYEYIPFSSKLKEHLKALEIEIERQICTRKIIGYELYKYARKQGKRIIAVSDMYLDSITIKDILNKAGYFIDNIIVSCEYRAEKYDGKLFEAAIRLFCLDRKSIVHFGDHFVSDLIGARRAFICSRWIPSDKNLYYLKPKGDYDMDNYLLPFINNHLSLIHNRAERVGYEVFGPLMVGFCKWLHRYLHENHFNMALFCARDMKQALEIYLMLYPEDRERVCYFYVSVKALTNAYNALKGSGSNEALQQLCYIRDYFSQLKCEGKVALVDSGINGRSQMMITEIVKDKFELHGFYIRISKSFFANVKDRQSKAYLNNGQPDTKLFISALFFETLISTTHGRTLRYGKKEGKIEPILGNGNPRSLELQQLQNGINKFAADYCSCPYRNLDISPDCMRLGFLKLAFFPMMEDVKTLKNIPGGNEVFSPIVIQPDKDQKLYRPSLFFRDLKATYWKGGYFKNAFPIVSVPLIAIYIFIDSFLIDHFGNWKNTLDPQ